MEILAEILETMMIIGFGVSWPLSIYKSYTSKSTKGKSILFLFCIAIGYLCGIFSKLISHNLNLLILINVLSQNNRREDLWKK